MRTAEFPRRLALALLVATLALAPAGTGAASAPRTPLAEGDVLPALEGTFLSGRAANLPAEARGRVAVLLLGFRYASRAAVEPWGEALRARFARDSGVVVYEVPMLAGVGARLGKPFIESGMRRGTPAALHENVLTVWHDVEAWKRRLSVVDPDLAYVVVLDRDGRVRWHGASGADRARLGEVTGEIQRLRATP